MRIARLIEPHRVHHVISRFVDKRWLLEDEEDRELYLRLLAASLAKSDWLLLAYALMSSHIHLSLLSGLSSFESLLKRVHAPFALEINRRREGLGPIFAARASASVVRPEKIGRHIAYLHNNPVRGGAVRTARESSWTSHRAYVGLVRRPRWLAVDEGLLRSGVEASAFDAFVAAAADDDGADDIDGIHRAAHRRGGIEVATPLLNPIVAPLVARRFAVIRPDPRAVITIVAATLGLSPERVTSRNRQVEVSLARCVAVHSGIRVGLTATEMSAALGICRQAGAKIAARQLGVHAAAATDVTVERLSSKKDERRRRK